MVRVLGILQHLKKLACRNNYHQSHLSSTYQGASMPMTKKGMKIREALEKEYGKKKGESVFYAMENAGKIKGVTKGKKK
jgi:hypothetical protein